MVAPVPSQRAKFPLGRLLLTPGAIEALERSGESPLPFLAHHAAGDWGDVGTGDWQLNDESVAEGTRILSAYKTTTAEKIWIITEADRSATTILLPDEY
jgi:hypothetical protein